MRRDLQRGSAAGSRAASAHVTRSARGMPIYGSGRNARFPRIRAAPVTLREGIIRGTERRKSDNSDPAADGLCTHPPYHRPIDRPTPEATFAALETGVNIHGPCKTSSTAMGSSSGRWAWLKWAGAQSCRRFGRDSCEGQSVLVDAMVARVHASSSAGRVKDGVRSDESAAGGEPREVPPELARTSTSTRPTRSGRRSPPSCPRAMRSRPQTSHRQVVALA